MPKKSSNYGLEKKFEFSKKSSNCAASTKKIFFIEVGDKKIDYGKCFRVFLKSDNNIKIIVNLSEIMLPYSIFLCPCNANDFFRGGHN